MGEPRAAGAPAAAARGLRFTAGQARLLFWSLAALGTGLLAWGKSLLPRAGGPDAEPPLRAVSEDVFAPYAAAMTPRPPSPPPNGRPATQKAAPRPVRQERVFEVELE